MKLPLIVNDNRDVYFPGDVGVSEDAVILIQAREIYDVGDPQLHIFDSEGTILELYKINSSVFDIRKTDQNLDCDKIRSMLRMAIMRWSENIEISSEMGISSLAWLIFERDPNPYS